MAASQLSSAQTTVIRRPELGKAEESPSLQAVAKKKLMETVID
jgi:hypothetical protein